MSEVSWFFVNVAFLSGFQIPFALKFRSLPDVVNPIADVVIDQRLENGAQLRSRASWSFGPQHLGSNRCIFTRKWSRRYT
jgi:hypothetical protein